MARAERRARRAGHRHRPARRRRARPLPGAARARRRRPGALPHRARRADRSPGGLQRRRRRLRDQAVSLRRAGRPPARAAAPLRRRRRRRRSARCGWTRWRHAITGERRRGVADADRVPAARGAGRPARARSCAGASSSARRWPDGAIVHDNTLDQYVARLRRKLRETRRRRDDRDRRTASATGCDEALSHAARPADRARPARGAGRPWRCSRWRSTSSWIAASTPTPTAALRSLAAAAATTVEYRRRPPARARVASTTRSSTGACGSTRATARSSARPRRRELQRAADALAGRRARVRRRARARRAPLRRARERPAGARSGTVVAAQSLAAYDRTTDLALLGSARARRLVLLAAVGVLTWITVGRALDPVREMTALGRRLERARPRPALRRDAAPRRARRAGADVRRAPGPRGGEPAPRAAPVGRALARAAHAAGADRGRDRAAAAPRALARGPPRRLRGRRAQRRADGAASSRR